MNTRSKSRKFNPAVLPMEYLPRVPYASDDKHTKHYLIPGKIFVTAQPFAISTIVGSSVVLCLWDSVSRFGNEGERLGDRNVQAVTHFLNMNGIRLVQSEVGGTHGRKLVFQTDDGRAWSEQI